MRSRSTAAALIVVLIALVVHAGALGGWWMSDDPQVLVQAMSYSPSQILFQPDAWRYLSSSSFTPLVTLSFELDLALTGMQPWWFYLHQIVMLALAACLLFLLVGGLASPPSQSPAAGPEFLRMIPALLAAIAFVVSPAAFVASRGLMVRHYVEGLVLALAALLAWRSRRGRGASADWIAGIASALFYLGAMLAKEFYTPLPLVMLAMSRIEGSSMRTTLRRLVPVSLSAVVYIAWRSWMLGSVGGYGGGMDLERVAEMPATLWHAMTGSTPLVVRLALGALVLILFLGAAVLRPRRSLEWAFWLGAFTIVPLIPLAASPEERYVFVATCVLAASLGLAARVIDRAWSTAALAVIVVLLGWGGLLRCGTLEFDSRAIVAEGTYVWSRSPAAPAILASAPGWYLDGLQWIRAHQGRGEGPDYVLSLDSILFGGADPSRLVRSEWGTGRILPVDRISIGRVERSRQQFSSATPLEVDFRRTGNDLRWTVGPRGGTFTFVTLPHYAKIPIPAEGWRRIPQPREKQFFRIRRDDPSGRWTISPVFEVPQAGGRMEWSRAEEKAHQSGERQRS